MTASGTVIKSTAKTGLKNNWLKSIIACLIFTFSIIICIETSSYISYVFGNIAGVVYSVLLIFFILIPLFIGTVRFFWRLSYEVNDSPAIVFYYFTEKSLYYRTLKLAIAILSRVFVIGIVLYIPAIIIDIFSGTKVYDIINIPIPMWTSNLQYLSIFVKSLATIILSLVLLRFYLAPILFVADESMDAYEAVHLSQVISKNTFYDLILFIISLIGWILLSILVIPLIFTLPYFFSCYTVHSRFAIAEYNKHIDMLNVDNSHTFVAGI